MNTLETTTALSIFEGGFDGSTAALGTVGAAGIALAAIRWGVPYLKGFFKRVAS